ncbi:hypothetical protein Misp01_01220 [Microtetraspora sp. NBRC 13810]|uniref:DUF3618 domain-containing protein n=1 Tax=Microtetraspora sp. NBRC 13810 TaxID=3030990 RepID=UPI0024A1EAA6|nr:DUF3618 domain-containing protein [Microtetraspora sp. NBRC 13810]GLW04992.1 hypothetical protein Misp01_01220 [Microtetraspora sp. NBRC 13810]
MADTDPDELERRIERTRAELARTVDAIADRVSPKRVAQRGVAKVRANAEQLCLSVSETVADVVGVGAPKPAVYDSAPDDAWNDADRFRDPARDLAPVLIGVGAVLMVGAAVMLWRRRRR